jgi:hypothetical protein
VEEKVCQSHKQDQRHSFAEERLSRQIQSRR